VTEQTIERLFTLEEANALIPRLEIIMSKLQRHSLALREALTELAQHTEQPLETLSTAQILELRPQLQPVVDALETLLYELESWGVQLKGLDLGLIDFPAELNGEIVLLCWQYGEKEVAYYHSPEAGFAGRTPLDPKAERLLQ
jgi:hypothetical protein